MNLLHKIDCMDYMKDIPDNHFDLAIVDPPYGIGDFTSSKSKHKKVDWNEVSPGQIYFDEIKRISKNQIIWGVNYYNIPFPGGRIIHDKMDGGKQKQSATMSDMDIAYHSFNNLIKVFRYGWKGTIQGTKINWDNTGIDSRIHPCQKPVALYKWLLINYAKPGDKLLDTHSGSGSFRIAAYDLGFDLVSCELDPDYYRDNEARYQNHIKQGELFTSEEIQKHVYTDSPLFDRLDKQPLLGYY